MTPHRNFFEILGLEPRYPLERAALDAAYERLSLENHPDLFAAAGNAERARAERISAELNEAYRVVASESERAAYLLGLLRGERELDGNALPEGFLQEMFFLQEEVEELGEEADGQRKAALAEPVNENKRKLLAEREELFAKSEENGSLEVLQAIQTNLNCEKYFNRLLKRLE